MSTINPAGDWYLTTTADDQITINTTTTGTTLIPYTANTSNGSVWINDNNCYGYPNNTRITLDPWMYEAPVPITTRLQNIKELEELKKEHSLEEFHIIVDGQLMNKTYVFMTDSEVRLLQKYSTQLDEISDPESFKLMLTGIEQKLATLVLGSTGESYDNIEDLRKDHLVLKLAGVQE